MKVKEVLKNKRGGDGEEWRNGSVRGGQLINNAELFILEMIIAKLSLSVY